MKAQIILETDERVYKRPVLKDYVTNQSGDYVLLTLPEGVFVVLKAVDEKKKTTEHVRMTAGSIARDLGKKKITEAVIEQSVLSEYINIADEQVVIAFVEGWHLGNYSFNTYQSKKDIVKPTLSVNGSSHEVVEVGEIRADATSFARDLMNELSNVLNPETFPTRLQEEFKDTAVEVTVFDKSELEKREMNGVLTVGQGSQYEPRFVELKYCNDSSKPLVALVGKGVTFDTGGISLKGSRNLSDMRMDMGGAAAVSGALKLLAKSEAKVNVVGLIPMVENNIDQSSVLPGEVIKYKNGKTVQIGNTDAEGRLILADGLIRAGELEADYVVDIATLTGAIWAALGSKMAGVFGEHELQVMLKELGDENGDFNWPMPLVDAYESYLKSDYADICNISNKGEAGSITAALFLRHFVPENTKWAHVDIAGVMESTEKGYYGNSATGFGTRLLADFTVRVSQ
ncbi:leucyl aminopeptidase [Cerasibacillus quisquiliarum]|mgnify:CR=1 FL=1|uniref:Probable cytosol aminopeptidase n=1 Tax=Cerasibacillus quisquiliarum TaxID=227865 RepID=A0A511UTU7_9BACI|nr:leucyl aminopeptidase family protein [Cerasibacillus quisquiliarum]MBB5145093.1 leucyl aminopeptidase [Cerasibacillus quisquiliarum]GEN30017.1 putative cytosol aminopeptidase [Cerasibacillus quisquiliarum]